MSSRRAFILASLGSLTALAGLPSCSTESGVDSYKEVAHRTWRQGTPAAGDKAALLHSLVRYAKLVPSSHNTQCWKFRLEEDAISMLPDLSRRCPAVDPDDHHLFVSLGCAAENLVQAALANGRKAHAGFASAGDGTLRVALEPTRPVASTLFQAIPERQSTRGAYDGQPIAGQELQLLEKAGTGRGVQVVLLIMRQAMEAVLEFVVQGNTVQMNDKASVAELKKWTGFSSKEAVRTGDGKRRPDLVVRFGRGPKLPSSLRRPVEAVLV